MLNCSCSIKTFKIEHMPQYPKVLIHFIDTSSDPVLLHYLLTMKNSCHVGVEVDVFYKLAFFFLFWKNVYFFHINCCNQKLTESLHCVTVLKASRKMKRKLILQSVLFMTKHTKEFRLLHKKMIVIYDLRNCYLSLTTARHSSITRITDTSAGTRLSRTGIVHICKSHKYLHTNYLKLAINSSILCIHVFVVFWSNFNP